MVTIGITKENLTTDKILSQVIQDLVTRREQLTRYIEERGYENRAKIILIEDFYGNTLTDRNIDALFSDIKNTEKIDIINEERKKIAFPQLKSINVPVLLDDRGVEISSTRIRTGKIDRNGKVFLDDFSKDLKLPNNLRESLREPFGRVVKDFDGKMFGNATFLIAVGDIVVSDLMNNNLIPDLAIFDLHTKKKRISDKRILENLPKVTVDLENKAGEIGSGVAKAIDQAFDRLIERREITSLKIAGEEDLLALPSIVLAPIGSIVVYGLRDQGAVVVRVTEEIKGKIVNMYSSKFAS